MAERDLTEELELFIRERAALQAKYAHQWVVFAAHQFRGAFEQYETAARFAVEHHANDSFLVRNLDDDDEYVPLIFAEIE